MGRAKKMAANGRITEALSSLKAEFDQWRTTRTTGKRISASRRYRHTLPEHLCRRCTVDRSRCRSGSQHLSPETREVRLVVVRRGQ